MGSRISQVCKVADFPITSLLFLLFAALLVPHCAVMGHSRFHVGALSAMQSSRLHFPVQSTVIQNMEEEESSVILGHEWEYHQN